MLNLYCVVGRIGSDAEKLDNHNAIRFSVAVDRTYYKDREKVEKTEWLSCIWFGETALKLMQYLGKGALVQVSGVPQATGYQAKDGTIKAKLGLKIDRLNLLQSASKAVEAKPIQDDDDLPY